MENQSLKSNIGLMLLESHKYKGNKIPPRVRYFASRFILSLNHGTDYTDRLCLFIYGIFNNWAG
jgi:hypothetical protein